MNDPAALSDEIFGIVAQWPQELTSHGGKNISVSPLCVQNHLELVFAPLPMPTQHWNAPLVSYYGVQFGITVLMIGIRFCPVSAARARDIVAGRAKVQGTLIVEAK